MDTPERVSANNNLLPKTHTFLHDETALKMPSESVMLACINPNLLITSHSIVLWTEHLNFISVT